MNGNRLAALALAAAAALPGAAHAVEYTQGRPQQGTIGFTYRQMGVPMNGGFGRFAARIAFDPARPAAASAAVDIDVASIDAGSPEASQEAVGKAWFDAKAHPVARFASTSVRALGGNRYEMAGRLTVKGRAKDVVVPVTFTPRAGDATLAGTLTIRRSEFAIGQGEWSAFDIVGDDVRIAFRIVVAPR